MMDAVARELDHHVEYLLDHLGIERGCRLVEEDQLGIHRQGASDGGALLLPAGQLGGVLRRVGVDAHAHEQVHAPPLGLMTRDLAHIDRAQRDVLRMVLCAKRLNDWNTMPISVRSLASPAPSSGRGRPSKRIAPPSIVPAG
jgi:hypothetical protein